MGWLLRSFPFIFRVILCDILTLAPKTRYSMLLLWLEKKPWFGTFLHRPLKLICNMFHPRSKVIFNFLWCYSWCISYIVMVHRLWWVLDVVALHFYHHFWAHSQTCPVRLLNHALNLIQEKRTIQERQRIRSYTKRDSAGESCITTPKVPITPFTFFSSRYIKKNVSSKSMWKFQYRFTIIFSRR